MHILPDKNYKKLMDKSFVSFLGKDESFKVYVLTTLCYYIYSNSGMEEKKPVTHPGG